MKVGNIVIVKISSTEPMENYRLVLETCSFATDEITIILIENRTVIEALASLIQIRQMESSEVGFDFHVFQIGQSKTAEMHCDISVELL